MTDHKPDEPGTRYHDECYVCPIGGLFLTARTSPHASEALDHLVTAASELVAAARAMAEAAEQFLDQQRAPSERRRVQRIDVEDGGESARADSDAAEDR